MAVYHRESQVCVFPLLDSYCFVCQQITTWNLHAKEIWLPVFLWRLLPLSGRQSLVCHRCLDTIIISPHLCRQLDIIHTMQPYQIQTLYQKMVAHLESNQLQGKNTTQLHYLRTLQHNYMENMALKIHS